MFLLYSLHKSRNCTEYQIQMATFRFVEKGKWNAKIMRKKQTMKDLEAEKLTSKMTISAKLKIPMLPSGVILKIFKNIRQDIYTGASSLSLQLFCWQNFVWEAIGQAHLQVNLWRVPYRPLLLSIIIFFFVQVWWLWVICTKKFSRQASQDKMWLSR